MIVDLQKLLTYFVIVSQHVCGIGPSPVRKHRYSGSVTADGSIKITPGLTASMPKASPSPSVVRTAKEPGGAFSGGVGSDDVIKRLHARADVPPNVSPSIVRKSKEERRLEVDANGIIEISADLGDEVRDTNLRKYLLREGLRAQNINVEQSEDPRRLTTFSFQPFHITQVESVQITNLLKLANKSDFRQWLQTDVPPIIPPSRFTPFSILHLCLTSSLFTVVLLLILIFMMSIVLAVIVHEHMRRDDPVRQRLVEAMQSFGIVLDGDGPRDANDSDSGSEVWEGDAELKDWEGFLWKLNSQVQPEEHPMWTHWRTRYFYLKVGMMEADGTEIRGVYVEFISEKGNMTGVRHWATERKPAIVSLLEPIQT